MSRRKLGPKTGAAAFPGVDDAALLVCRLVARRLPADFDWCLEFRGQSPTVVVRWSWTGAKREQIWRSLDDPNFSLLLVMFDDIDWEEERVLFQKLLDEAALEKLKQQQAERRAILSRDLRELT